MGAEQKLQPCAAPGASFAEMQPAPCTGLVAEGVAGAVTVAEADDPEEASFEHACGPAFEDAYAVLVAGACADLDDAFVVPASAAFGVIVASERVACVGSAAVVVAAAAASGAFVAFVAFVASAASAASAVVVAPASAEVACVPEVDSQFS